MKETSLLLVILFLIIIGYLFVLCQPGYIFTLPPQTKESENINSQPQGFFKSIKTSIITALVHSIIFMTLFYISLYKFVSLLKISTYSFNVAVLVCGLLFFILSPGILINIPPVDFNITGKFFSTGITTKPTILIHALVFVTLLYILINLYTKKLVFE